MADAFSFDSFHFVFLLVILREIWCIRLKSRLDQPAQRISGYFRQQFYDTGDFFPEFAAGIGGGQNIYNFAYYGLSQSCFFVVLSASFCENERLSDCSILHLPCISSCIALLLAHKKRVLPDCQLSDCTVVFAVSTYDFSVLQPDYVCQLYAVSVYGSLGCGFFPGKRKNRFSIYPVYF